MKENEHLLFALAVATKSRYYQSGSHPVEIDYDRIPQQVQSLADHITEGVLKAQGVEKCEA